MPSAHAAAVILARSFLTEVRASVDAYLDAALPPSDGAFTRLPAAMRYSVMAGGKRLRPALAIASCRAVGGTDEQALPYAAALELIHTYSLIHDDLPAMDDDDLRRGRPTSHRQFDEATAILAGDGLHTLAFEIVLARTEPPERAARAAWELAHAAGPAGMVGGQAEDVEADGKAVDEDALLRIQGGKTAALLTASCRGGAIAGGAREAQIDALGDYGRHIGYAFQIVDDVLDVTGTAEVLGKTPGKDAQENRATWVALEGVDAARARAAREVQWAREALAAVEEPTLLEALALFVTSRDR